MPLLQTMESKFKMFSKLWVIAQMKSIYAELLFLRTHDVLPTSCQISGLEISPSSSFLFCFSCRLYQSIFITVSTLSISDKYTRKCYICHKLCWTPVTIYGWDPKRVAAGRDFSMDFTMRCASCNLGAFYFLISRPFNTGKLLNYQCLTNLSFLFSCLLTTKYASMWNQSFLVPLAPSHRAKVLGFHTTPRACTDALCIYGWEAHFQHI